MYFLGSITPETFLAGVQNFLKIIHDNWTTIIVIVALIIALIEKIKSFFSKSKEEQIEIVKQQIKEMILKWVTDAEVDYQEWTKAGSIKRSQVIQKVFEEFPVLNEVTNQEELIKWIDECIDEALENLRGIIDEQIKTQKHLMDKPTEPNTEDDLK